MKTAGPPTATLTKLPRDETTAAVVTADEDRMKYVCKMGMAQNVSKGSYDLAVQVWAKLFERHHVASFNKDPNWESHLEMRSGAIWILAIR